MLKRYELTDPKSCLNKASDEENLFVLLGRDPAAPAAIRAWIAERIRLGKNAPGDGQILEAAEWLGPPPAWAAAPVPQKTKEAGPGPRKYAVIESMTRIVLPNNEGYLRVWREQDEVLIEYRLAGEDLRSLVFGWRVQQMSTVGIVDALAALPRVNAVEYTSCTGQGVVVYKEWP